MIDKIYTIYVIKKRAGGEDKRHFNNLLPQPVVNSSASPEEICYTEYNKHY